MGVDFDLAAKPLPTASIPEDKKAKTLRLIDEALAKHAKVEAKLAEELHGLLNWVGELLVAGRFHLRHVNAAHRRAKRKGAALATKHLRAQLRWWQRVIKDWNCVAVVLPPLYAAPRYSFRWSPTTDACKDEYFAGAGAWFNGWFDFFEFTAEERDAFDIMELEAIVFYLWLATLVTTDPSLVEGRLWTARCDNEPWVAVVNKGMSAKSVVCAELLAALHQLQCRFHFGVRVEYINTHDNIISDLLSRARLHEFRRHTADSGFPLRRLQVMERFSLTSRLQSAKCSARLSPPVPSSPSSTA